MNSSKKISAQRGQRQDQRGRQRVQPQLRGQGLAQLKTMTAFQIRQPPSAPPVYRPQEQPRVLQTKTTTGQQSQVRQSPRQPVAPPVYRPEPKKIVQPKMAVAVSARKLLKAPPVFRPQPATKVLQTSTPSYKQQSPGVKTLAPPIYRPQPTPMVLQTKRSQTSGERLNSSAHVGRGVPLFAPRGVIQPYTPNKKDKSVLIGYKNRYVAANGNDDYYESVFEEYVVSAASMDDIKKFVEAAELKAKERIQKVSTLTKGAEEEIKKPLKPTPSERKSMPSEEEKKELPTQKKKQKSKKTHLDISGPPLPLAYSTVSYVDKVSSGFTGPLPMSSTSSSLSSGPSKVQKCLGFVQKWDGKIDDGREVTLSVSDMENLVHGLDNIVSFSGKTSKYFVGVSVGESKYSSHVCIKAIAGYSKEVGFKTAHKPTYHFEVINQDEIPSSLTSYQLDEKS